MGEETRKEFLTEEQLKQLETAVNTFINGFKKIVQDNRKEVDVEVKERDDDGNVIETKTEKQKRIFDKYTETDITNKFKFIKDDYKFSIDKFKKGVEEKNKSKTEDKDKTTISDIAIKETVNKVFTYSFCEARITNYINIETNKQTKQNIFNLFKTLITSLIDNKVITKDFFKDNSNIKIGRIFSILAIYSPDDTNFTELTNKLLERLDEKDKKNVLSYGKLNGAINNEEQNATYFLLQNPNIVYSSVEEIVKNTNENNIIENLVSSKNILNLLKQEHIINNQEKSKQLIDLFLKVLKQDLKGSEDEVKKYFSSSINNHGKYSNFLLDYIITFNKIKVVDRQSKFKAQFSEIISKLKEKFGEDFVIDLLSGITIKYNEYKGKTEFNFLNTDLIQEQTIRDKVTEKINQKKVTLKVNDEGKIEKFERLSKLVKENSGEFKKEFLKLGSYDEKMAYLCYGSNLPDLYDNIEYGFDEDNNNNLQEYKRNIKIISECDPEFTVNFISNIYKNTDSDNSLNISKRANTLINNANINIPQVLLNYNEKVKSSEIKDEDCFEIKKLVSKYNIIENISYNKETYCKGIDTSQIVIDTLKLINELYGYDELKNALIYNRTSTGCKDIFTLSRNPNECNYNTFEQIISLTIESAKNAGKNPYEELVNDILPHFGGENWSFRHIIFELASFNDIKKYLNKVKEICNSYDTEKSQTEGTSFSNLLLNNYGANILDLMNEKKEDVIADEGYREIKEILGDELYKTLVSRSKNEYAKNILTQEEKSKIEEQKNKRKQLINKMADMVQTQNVDGIKSKLNKITSEDERLKLLHTVFMSCTVETEDKCIVVDYDNIINTVSNLIDDEKYKILANKLCKNKVGNAFGYNLMADALITRDDIIDSKETYYKNILNILSKLEKEDIIYILNQRNYNGNSENLLCSLIDTKKRDIDYITSLIKIIYDKIGHDEFQKIMGNKAVVSDFKYKVKHSLTLNAKEGDEKNKANLVKNFMSSIQQNRQLEQEVVEQIQATTNTYLETTMGNEWNEKYKEQNQQTPTEPKPTQSKPTQSSTQQTIPQQPEPSVQSILQQTTEPKSQPKPSIVKVKSEPQKQPSVQSIPQQTTEPKSQPKPIEQPEPSVQSIHQQQRQSKLTEPKPAEHKPIEQPEPSVQSIPQQTTEPKSQPKPSIVKVKSEPQKQPSVQSIPQQTTAQPTSQSQTQPSIQSMPQQLTQPKPTQSLTQQTIPQQAATQPNSQPTSQSQTQPKSTQSSTLQTIQQPKAVTYKNTEIHPSKTTSTTEKDETNLVRNNTIKSNNKNNNNELLKVIILMSAMNYINANRGRNINPIELMLNTVSSVVPMVMFCGSMFGINNNMTNPMEIMQEVMKTTFEIMPMFMIMTTITPKINISTINNKQQKLNNLRKASGDFNMLVNGIGRMNYLS